MKAAKRASGGKALTFKVGMRFPSSTGTMPDFAAGGIMKRQICLAVSLSVFLSMSALAQTSSGPVSPPPFPERLDAFSHPIPKMSPSTFAIGNFTGKFEDTRFDEVERTFGGVPHKEGDASEAVVWLCYTLPQNQRIWLSSGELAGGTYIDEVDMVALPASTSASAQCPAIQAKTHNVDGVSLGMTKANVRARLGPPSRQQGDWLIYKYETAITIGGARYDVLGSIDVHFTGNTADRIIANRDSQS